jgi:hypothetical protein
MEVGAIWASSKLHVTTLTWDAFEVAPDVPPDLGSTRRGLDNWEKNY